MIQFAYSAIERTNRGGGKDQASIARANVVLCIGRIRLGAPVPSTVDTRTFVEIGDAAVAAGAETDNFRLQLRANIWASRAYLYEHQNRRTKALFEKALDYFDAAAEMNERMSGPGLVDYVKQEFDELKKEVQERRGSSAPTIRRLANLRLPEGRLSLDDTITLVRGEIVELVYNLHENRLVDVAIRLGCSESKIKNIRKKAGDLRRKLANKG